MRPDRSGRGTLNQPRPRTWYGRSVPRRPSAAPRRPPSRPALSRPTSRRSRRRCAPLRRRMSPSPTWPVSAARNSLTERHAPRGVLAHECDHRIDLVALQFDPLPTQPDQRLLQAHQALELVAREFLAAQRHLPVIRDHRVEAEKPTPLPRCPLDRQAELRLDARRFHQGGSSTPKSASAESWRRVDQELVRLYAR